MDIEKLIAKYYQRQDKNLGQNFLICEHTAEQIVTQAQIQPTDLVIEIGSGPGILTQHIAAQKPKKIIAIDIDPRSKQSLRELQQENKDSLEVVTTNALHYDISNLGHRVKIIANLPYNISTTLFIKWLAHITHIESMTLMFQKEVAMRICAQPNSKKYGWLSIYAQALCQTHMVLNVSADLFKPPPKVDSGSCSSTTGYKLH